MRRAYIPPEKFDRAAYARKKREVRAAIEDAGDPRGTSDVRAFCPFCVSSKTGQADRSLSFSPATGDYYCQRCNEAGHLKGYGPEPDADGWEPDLDPGEPAPVGAVEPPEGFTPLAYGDGAEAIVFEDARAFAQKRGLTPELLFAMEVGACITGSWRGRLVVPFPLPEGGWWGYVGRDYTGRADLKYRYPKAIPRRERLYNESALAVETDEPVLVVEGVLDCAPFWPHAVALLGKPSDAHVEKLARARRPVCLVLDGDAWELGWSLAARLRFEGARAGSVRLPPKTDPDEVPVDWLRAEVLRALESDL
jgi:hypothetical protein